MLELAASRLWNCSAYTGSFAALIRDSEVEKGKWFRERKGVNISYVTHVTTYHISATGASFA